MKTLLVRSVLLTIAVSPAVLNAADKPTTKGLVKKGIAFLGGAKKLKSLKAATWGEKGTYYGMGDGLPYTGKYAMEAPDKYRMEIVGFFTSVVNGKQGWIKMGDTATELTKEQLKENAAQLYISRITQLYPLLGKEFKLTLVDDENIGGQPTFLIKVESKGHRTAKLNLHVKTGMLVKAEWMGPMEGMPEKLVKYETFYSDYKTAKGLKYPSKLRMTRDGKKFVEATLTDYQPAESVDAKNFAKP